MKIPNRRIDLRKLAAIEILFLGSKLILAEYACGVLLSIALGLFVVFRSRSPLQFLLGVYLICLGINYVPMFIYAVALRNKRNAGMEIADELDDTRRAMSRYRVQSLILLVPLSAPILAWVNKRSK